MSLYPMPYVPRLAAAINLGPFGLSQGSPAHLVVLDQPNVLEALRFHAPPTHVISNGRLVDTARMRAIAAAPVRPA
jgi:cytosine deaminase